MGAGKGRPGGGALGWRAGRDASRRLHVAHERHTICQTETLVRFTMPRRHCLHLLFCLALCVTVARAQNITGTILGTVTDASGAVIANAEVLVINTGTNQSVRVLTNQLGNFEAPYLRPGKY